MAPKAASLSLLFHPKKDAKKDLKKDTPPRASSPRKPATVPFRPKAAVEEEEEGLKLPDGPFQEFKLMSSALNGWKYDVMKFDSRKPVDISRWHPPVKLNRKELRKEEDNVDAPPQAVAPMLGPDGKPVIGMDGKIVMVDMEGRPIQSSSAPANGAKGKGPAANGKKRFQKKTRQVFFVPEEVRQLRREERYPWVMEDSSPNKNEVWIGQMEDASKSDTHAFFMPAANDVFKFVPAHRWYKFQKKLKHDFPTDTAEVESLYTRSQKRDPQAWLAGRNGKGPSSATAALFKAEAEGRAVTGEGSLVHSSGQSLGPGGRKLKVVDSGADRLMDGNDEEDGGSRRRLEKELGGEGDLDEQVFEEDFADDEEPMDVDEKDEAAKEIEERLKREYKAANKLRDAGVEDPDEEVVPGQSKQAKAMQKLIRNREGNEAYESDEEENPYASSEEEEESEPAVPSEPVTQPQPEQVEPKASSQPPKATARPSVQAPSPNGSPRLSPTLGGGHSVVAKRATSPKPPKPILNNNASRGNSPLGSRAQSPVGSNRAASPGAGGVGCMAAQKTSIKRKAVDEALNGASSAPTIATGSNVAPKPKKRKAQGPAAANVPSDQLKGLLVEWLASAPNATTKNCIHYFTPYLTDSEKKAEFSGLVREVAQLKEGVLVLRKKFQGGETGISSPRATSPS